MITLLVSSGKSIHWIFTSQYIKACILLPSYERKKKLLLEMYDEKTEQEYHLQPLYGSFLDRHDEFENLIMEEREK